MLAAALSAFCCLWTSGAALAQEEAAVLPVLAVFEIQVDGFSLSQRTITRLTGYLSSRITACGVYQCVPTESIQEALAQKRSDSTADQCDRSCRIEIGATVAAGKTLNSLVWRVGGKCSLTIDLYDIRTELMEKSVEVPDLACDEAGLKRGISLAAQKISLPLVGPAPAVPSRPTYVLPTPPENEGVADTDNEEAPLPPVKAEVGFLSVEGGPAGARVDIHGPSGFGENGVAATSLPVRPIEVPAGTYSVKVSMAGYDASESTVRVYADSTQVARVTLVKSTGEVQISGKPEGARSRLECQGGFVRDFGLPVTPWTVTVPHGECRLSVERDGYAKYDQRFAVEGGGTSTQSVELQRETAGVGSGSGSGSGVSDVTWVRIPGGTFQMGSTDGDDDETPVHSVTVATFEMSKTEVTNGQYQRCVQAGACSAAHWDDGTCRMWNGSSFVQGSLPQSFRGSGQPVVCVDWAQATAYARWVGGRLPTEAEWEYAARSGGRNQTYPWGNQTATCSYAVMSDGGSGCGRGVTWPVCSKTAGNTSQGLCDMAGNVWEWVSDWYGSGYYANGPKSNPTGPVGGSNRVKRGGSFVYYVGDLRASFRLHGDPSGDYVYLGFRCARSQL